MTQTPVPITGGTGTSSIAAELVGGTSYQEIEVVGQGGSSTLGINPDGSIKASIIGTPTVTFSGSPSISGAVTIVGTVPITVSGSVLTLNAPTASLVSGVTSVITGTASVLVVAAAPGAQRNYITQILATNAAAVGTFVNILDNGLVIYSGYAAASGGGFSASFPTPLKQPSTISALYAATTSQASVVVAMSGFTGT